MNFSEQPRRKLLKGIAPAAQPQPYAWYNAVQHHAVVGNANNWGWLLSCGNVLPSIEQSSPLQAHPWMNKAHEWLTQRTSESQRPIMDMFPELHEAVTRQFQQTHPELSGENTPSMRRPWLDGALVDLQRTRNGVEVRYAATGLVAIGIHSGVQDRWIMPSSVDWHRLHFQKYKENIARHGCDSVQGKKALMDWHMYCRKNINKPGGFTAWSLGDPFMQGWTSGRIHISEMPFSVVLYNLGALALVDVFECYSTHKEVFDYIRTHKRMDNLLDKIHHAQNSDPLCKKFPRSMPTLPVGILAVHGE